MDYIITYNILFFRYDNSNNKENKGEKMKYENERYLLRYIMDISTTNSKLTDNKKWKREWRYITIEIDEFLNG